MNPGDYIAISEDGTRTATRKNSCQRRKSRPPYSKMQNSVRFDLLRFRPTRMFTGWMPWCKLPREIGTGIRADKIPNEDDPVTNHWELVLVGDSNKVEDHPGKGSRNHATNCSGQIPLIYPEPCCRKACKATALRMGRGHISDRTTFFARIRNST